MPGAAGYGSALYELRDVACRVYLVFIDLSETEVKKKIFDPWGHSRVISRISEKFAKWASFDHVSNSLWSQ